MLKKLKTKSALKFFTFSILLLNLFFLKVTPVNAQSGSASLYFSPASATSTVGSTFDIQIMVNTGGEDTTTVIADLTYSSSELEVVSIDDTSSVYDNSAEEDYSTAGTILITRYMSGGGSYNGTGEVLTITFSSLAEGTATLAFTSDASLMNDDLTPLDILDSTGTASVTISTSTGGSLPNAGISDHMTTLYLLFLGSILILSGITLFLILF